MKKLLVFATIMAMTSFASATIIDIVTDGVGDMGHAGTFEDPLQVGETIGVKIILNNNPHPIYPAYDGYTIDVMEVDLKPTNGSLSILQDSGGNDAIGVHQDWLMRKYRFNDSDDLFLGYASIDNIHAANGQSVDLIWNILLTAGNSDNIKLSLELTWYEPLRGDPHYGIVHVGDDYWPASGGPGASGREWYSATEDDFGDLTIFTASGETSQTFGLPEPMTICFLSFGGILVRRRKQD